MQETKGLQPKKDYKKEYQKIRIELLKNGSSLRKLCDSENLNRRNVYRAFNGSWNGEAARKLRERVIEVSKG